MVVRQSNQFDLPDIQRLAYEYEDKLMPYIFDDDFIWKFSRMFYVEEEKGIVVGAIHVALPYDEASTELLVETKLVPLPLVEEFIKNKHDLFLVQLYCNKPGSFGRIVKYLVSVSDRLHCFCSVNSKAFDSYQRHEFSFKERFHIWNPYKNGYSDFAYGTTVG